jgi:hypothetical protein
MVTREEIRQHIEAGLTPHDIFRDYGKNRAAYLLALEEEA